MNYDLLNLIVAILSLIVAIYTGFKENSTVSLQNKVQVSYETNIYVNKNLTNSNKSDSDDLIKGSLIVAALILIINLYYIYPGISFLILNSVCLICILVIFAFSKKNTNIQYAKYLNIELLTLVLLTVYLNLSHLNVFTPSAFDINNFSCEEMDWSSLPSIISSGVARVIDSIKYLFDKASFEVQTFFISISFFMLLSIVHIVSTFLKINKMRLNKYTPPKKSKQIRETVIINIMFIFFLLNILKILYPPVKAFITGDSSQ